MLEKGVLEPEVHSALKESSKSGLWCPKEALLCRALEMGFWRPKGARLYRLEKGHLKGDQKKALLKEKHFIYAMYTERGV